MDDTNVQKTAQDWVIELGCGCMGSILGIILFTAVLALFGASYVALLFTAPPLERMSQLNEFFQERFTLLLVSSLLVIMILGGGFGYWLGTIINIARHGKREATE